MAPDKPLSDILGKPDGEKSPGASQGESLIGQYSIAVRSRRYFLGTGKFSSNSGVVQRVDLGGLGSQNASTNTEPSAAGHIQL